MSIPRSSGVQLHVTSLPGGRLGPEALRFVDWLADAGQSWWQMLPLGPPDRFRSPYRSRSAFAASPQLLADPGAAVSRAGGGGVPRTPRLLDRGLGAARGRPPRAPRPGALRARMGAAAKLRRGAGRAPDRRPADLRRRLERRPHRPSRAVPGRRGRGRAARSLRERGPAVGQPPLRLARPAPSPLPLVDGAAAANLRALRPRADRPLPRLRRLLGGAGRRPRRLPRPLAARARSRSVRGGAPRARRAPPDRGGSGRDHPGGACGCAISSACPAWSCWSGRSNPPIATARTASRTTAPPASSTRPPTTRSRSSPGGRTSARPSAGASSRRSPTPASRSASRTGR